MLAPAWLQLPLSSQPSPLLVRALLSPPLALARLVPPLAQERLQRTSPSPGRAANRWKSAISCARLPSRRLTSTCRLRPCSAGRPNLSEGVN
jgi:hypothetical protein